MTITGSTVDQWMCVAAFRYCLHRRTAFASACHEWIIGHWGQFTPDTQDTITRETVVALMDADEEVLDRGMDWIGWKGIAIWCWEHTPEERKPEIRRRALGRGKRWPWEEND